MQILSFSVKSTSTPAYDDHKLEKYTNQYPNLCALKVAHIADSLHILLASNDISLLATTRENLVKDGIIKSTTLITHFSHFALCHPAFNRRLHKLSQQLNVHFKVTVNQEANEIKIYGPIHSIDIARTRLLVLLDELSGFQLEILENIPCHLHSVIAGRKHVNLQSIMEETGTNIYTQARYTHLSDNKIYITGPSVTDITRTKNLLTKLCSQKSASMFHRNLVIDVHKMDWILLNKKDQLQEIMYDNGSFFQTRERGPYTTAITVYGESRINVERSIRHLNQLITEVLEAKIELSKLAVELSRVAAESHKKLLSLFFEATQASGVTAVFKGNYLQLFGTFEQIKIASDNLLCNHFFKMSHRFTSLFIELATEHQEFVSGKKNGKINKITKICGVDIRFVKNNNYTSYVYIGSADSSMAWGGIAMVRDELPAEISFQVPEAYHRRIIGVGGKDIQRVMKKHGVYVKFSGTEEFSSMGGYYKNDDNVIARTPMKNKDNLEKLKDAISNLVSAAKDKDFVVKTLSVPYEQHTSITKNHSTKLREACRLNNCKIYWPERNGTDTVVVYGPGALVSKVTSLVMNCVVTERQFLIKVVDEKTHDYLSKPNAMDGLNKVIAASELLNCQMLPLVVLKAANRSKEGLQWFFGCQPKSKHIAIFRISCTGSNQKSSMAAVKDIVRSLFREMGFTFLPVSANTNPTDSKSPIYASEISSEESWFDMVEDYHLTGTSQPHPSSSYLGKPPVPLFPTFNVENIWEYHPRPYLPTRVNLNFNPFDCE